MQPPPSSGGAQIMIAGIYDHLIYKGINQQEKILHSLMRNVFHTLIGIIIWRSDEVDIPIDALLDPKYLELRSKERFKPNEIPSPGDPSNLLGYKDQIPIWGLDNTEEASGTTHISIIDFEGNAVSMTTTIESAFGSAAGPQGFIKQ